ncbi:hypothetical protein FIS3754_18890 [Fischerella sp. NIES-3754]|nr:hypothetical protein FIS3754_18890 [Fischerella sp. NIES-3754]BCX08260.1 MAG: hypothetical protein KatS3mg066_2119 [Fischerella sp.]
MHLCSSVFVFYLNSIFKSVVDVGTQQIMKILLLCVPYFQGRLSRAIAHNEERKNITNTDAHRLTPMDYGFAVKLILNLYFQASQSRENPTKSA